MSVSSPRGRMLQLFGQLTDVGKRQAAEMVRHLASTSAPSRFAHQKVKLTSWEEVVEQFDRLPKPRIERDYETSSIHERGWIYRGQNGVFPLAPAIEREFGDWAEMEYRILREFQSKAPLHFEPSQLPRDDTKRLEWLALMQHYGVPTRLLDCTYSPYVALYFAIRNRQQWQVAVEVWAIDAPMVRARGDKVLELKASEGGGQAASSPVSFNPEKLISSWQATRDEDAHWERKLNEVLEPSGAWRELFKREGMVLVALPRVQSTRLLRQQGAFLFNGSETLSFEESLEKMMSPVQQPWLKVFRIEREPLERIERELFQMNLHDLSLFPDAEGLAGVLRQKARVHW